MGKKLKEPVWGLPQQVFNAAAILYPRFVRVFESCGLKPVDLFALWYVRSHGYGEPVEGNKNTWSYMMLRKELGDVLKEQVGLSDPGVTGVLDRLDQDGHIRREKLSKEEKQKRFSTEKGTRTVVVVTLTGERKIEEFKRRFGESVKEIISGKGLPVAGFLKMIERFAAVVIRRSQG